MNATSALLVDQAAAVQPLGRCAAIAPVRWQRLLGLGMLVILGGLLVPPMPLTGASGKPEATVHEVQALHVHLVLLGGRTLSAGASTSGYVVINNTAKEADHSDARLRGKARRCGCPLQSQGAPNRHLRGRKVPRLRTDSGNTPLPR